ncbi:MAG: hypothetical protein KIT31_19695 [Deltaproteobacteria bacterium]|nr:hypothetical protein [Deltaproteobacteria bacterium]
MQTLLQYLAGLANDPAAQQAFTQNPDAAINAADLSDQDKAVLRTRNAGLIHATAGQQALAAVVYAPGQQAPAYIYASQAPGPQPPAYIYASQPPVYIYAAHAQAAAPPPPHYIYAAAQPPAPYIYAQPPVSHAPYIYAQQPAYIYATPPQPYIYAAQHQQPAYIYAAAPQQAPQSNVYIYAAGKPGDPPK